MAVAGKDRPRGASRAFLAYNGLRLGLLALCLGIGWLATLRGVVLLVAALAVSGVLSWFLLRRQREAMGMAVEQTVTRSRLREQLAARVKAEDEYADSILQPGEVAQPRQEPPST
jgi:hypothetical protein